MSDIEIKPKKRFYADENDLMKEFCDSSNCGPESVGESGGEGCYGCDAQEEFVADSQHLLEADHAEKVIDELEAENEKFKEALTEIRDYHFATDDLDCCNCIFNDKCVVGFGHDQCMQNIAHKALGEL